MANAMTLKRRDINTPEKREKYTVCILGNGRTGLTHACLFANAGFSVVYTDVDHHISNQMEKGRISPAGRKLNKLLNKHKKDGRLTAENNIREAVSSSDIIVFSVPATIDKREKPDYSSIIKNCKEVGLSLRPGSLFVLASTSGPGVTESLVKETLENASGLKAGKDFGLAHNSRLARTSQPAKTDRRVIGAINERSFKATSLVLETATKGRIVKVKDIKTAEMAKLIERIHEAVDIALANELAGFCEKAGIDFIEAQKAANTNPHSHLSLPQLIDGRIMIEPYLLTDEAEALNTKLRMFTLAANINKGMVGHTIRLVKDALRECGKTLRRAKISVFGVSCRSNTKEAKGSPVKKLVDALKKRGGHVRVYDSFFSHKELVEMGYQTERTLTKTVENSDCLIIAVGHTRFSRLNLRKIKLLVKKPAAIVDMGRVIDLDKAEKEGFVCRGVGRGALTRGRS